MKASAKCIVSSALVLTNGRSTAELRQTMNELKELMQTMNRTLNEVCEMKRTKFQP